MCARHKGSSPALPLLYSSPRIGNPTVLCVSREELEELMCARNKGPSHVLHLLYPSPKTCHP